MGIIDNIVSSAENDVESQANSKIQSAINSGMGKVGTAANKAQKCPKCGAALPNPMPNFCPKCGAKLMLVCPKCKKDYPLGTKFCPDDGSKLS